MNKISIRVNHIGKIEQLLQESYDYTCKSLIEIQNEMNKISNSTNFNDDTTMGEKSAYGKVIGDFIEEKRKFIALKVDIAKLLQDILKHGGNVKEALNDTSVGKRTSLDLKELRSIVTGNEQNADEDKVYKIK